MFVQAVAVAVVAICKPVGRGAAAGCPALIDHPAKLIHAGVLVTGGAVALAAQLDVGHVHARLGMGPANHRAEAEVVVAFQRRRAVDDG